MSQQPVSQRLPMTLTRSMLLLSLAIAVGMALLGAIGWRRFGWPGVTAAAVAAGVCWLGAAAALVSTAMMQAKSPLGGVFLGMFFRTGVPLAAALFLHSSVPVLAEAGVLGFMLGFYLLSLAVETVLAVRMVPRETKVMKTS